MMHSSHGFVLMFFAVSVGALVEEECASSAGDESAYLQVHALSATRSVPPAGHSLAALSSESSAPETDCGGHMAWNCASCPHGASGCNGDCEWVNNECVAKDRTQVDCGGGHSASHCASCPQGKGDGASWCNGECKWESNSNAQGGNCVDKCPMWACDGCQGTQCLDCQADEKVKCCYEEQCKGCGGEQCQLCKQEKCCSGENWMVPECQTPTPAPTPDCDLSACNGCSGTQCLDCQADEKVKCCYEEQCKGCGGEQCQLCKQEKCCSGENWMVPECQTP